MYSDHDMVLCDIKLKLKRNRKIKSTRFIFDVEKLLNNKTKRNLYQEIMVKLTQIDIQSQTTNTSYNEIAEIY